MRAADSVGSESASSIELCEGFGSAQDGCERLDGRADDVHLSCCAVSVELRSACESAALATWGSRLKRSFLSLPTAGVLQELGELFEQLLCELKRKRAAAQNRPPQATSIAANVTDGVGKRERKLCAAVEPASRMWYPEIEIVSNRHIGGTIGKGISDKPKAGFRRMIDICAAGNVFLRMSF